MCCMEQDVILTIRHFGPIENAELEIGKYTVVIGSQGTGKSSIAKIFSLFSWLEKSLVRHSMTEAQLQSNKFQNKKFCKFHRLSSFFRSDTYISYQGNFYSFEYSEGKVHVGKNESNGFTVPKIEYVPAERNILSATEKPSSLRGVPDNLAAFSDDFEDAKYEAKSFSLPINNASLFFEYDRSNKISWLKGADFRIRLSESSSGFQSLLPLCFVTQYLTDVVLQRTETQLTVDERWKLQKEVDAIMAKNLSDEVRDAMLKNVSQKYRYSYFINIVEEAELNLFPSSQKDVLFFLIEQCNKLIQNKLFLTTHSPYIISYLSLAAKAGIILEANKNDKGVIDALSKIVARDSCLIPHELKVYQIDNKGNVSLLPDYDGTPSDNNYLNISLSEINDLYNDLLEIEDQAV